ncbi:MAG: nucleoside triphosphate pyrophosphohydrolase family protein [Stellaceae bacterium]
MDDPERMPLLVADFEQRVVKTDEMEDPPDTAFLGLFGEIGSLVSALKKRRRDKDAYLGYEPAVVEEVGDVLWYASAFARRGGTSLAEVASRVIGDGAQPNQVSLGEIAPATEQPFSDAAAEAALLDLAGEAGDIAQRFKNGAYNDNADSVRGDLVKLLRPLSRASVAFGVSLDVAGHRNIAKTASRWRAGADFPPLFDEGLDGDERLPRCLRVEIYQRHVNGKDFVFQKCNGILIGDRLTDNHDPPDCYRFHDVFHFAYAAVLGWSPVTRALFKVKRKSFSNLDENEDGARAILMEEGLTTWIFETAKAHQFFANTDQLGFDLLKAVKGFVVGYEPQLLPMWLWERAILKGYAVFRELKEAKRGLVTADMAGRDLRFEALS